VHADETRVSVSGKEGYVWVFTNLEDVAFILQRHQGGQHCPETPSMEIKCT
jgi:hypothetical protein